MGLHCEFGRTYGDESKKNCDSCQHIATSFSDLFGESESCSVGGDCFEHSAEGEPNCPKWAKCVEKFYDLADYEEAMSNVTRDFPGNQTSP